MRKLNLYYKVILLFILICNQNVGITQIDTIIQAEPTTNVLDVIGTPTQPLILTLTEGTARIASSRLDSIFKDDNGEFVGLIIYFTSFEDNEVQFLEVWKPEGASFSDFKLEVRRAGSSIKAIARKKHRETIGEPFPSADFDFESIAKETEFEFTFFGAYQVLPIIANRETIEVFGSYIDFGDNNNSMVKGKHFTFRIEGKGAKRLENSIPFPNPHLITIPMEVNLPLFQAGIPCPPTWISGIPNQQILFFKKLSQALSDFNK